MEWWKDKWHCFHEVCKRAFKKKKENYLLEEKESSSAPLSRSTSALEGMALRLGRPPGMIVLDRPVSRVENRDELAKIDEKRGIVKPLPEKKEDVRIEEQSAKTSTMSVGAETKKDNEEV